MLQATEYPAEIADFYTEAFFLVAKIVLLVIIKPFFLAIGWSYLHDLSHTFLKRLKLLRG